MEALRKSGSGVLAVVLAACSQVSGSGGAPPGPAPTPTAVCGNGELNGDEACDGAVFSAGAACAALGLQDGSIGCTSACRYDFAGCSYRDYCTANHLYGDGKCDACDALGGVTDPDCEVACGADGTCADRYEPLVQAWTCKRLFKTDPDCGTCGDRIIQGNELCDGSAAADPATFKCQAHGYFAGEIGCLADCRLDFARCQASDCGDGRREGDEVCDAADFAGKSCADFGGIAGELACAADCSAVDAGACLLPGCNNGVREPSEECDGGDLAGASCASLGFLEGTLACDGNCGYDDSGCVAAGCDNGVREEHEQCERVDGTWDLGGATCASLGFLAGVGTLSCSPSSCTYDTRECVAAGCGNGILETPAEECEGEDVGGATCAAAGFERGAVVCADCRIDRSDCSVGCGNGIIDKVGESCDGSDFDGASCTDHEFSGGPLRCDDACHLDLSQCTGRIRRCGNGLREPGEACDGGEVDSALTCQAIGLGSGSVGCTEGCVPDFSGCQSPDLCAALNLYSDPLATCDPCEEWGGNADPDCAAACDDDSICAGYWDMSSGFRDTCELTTGHRDPDCVEFCGSGGIEGIPGTGIPIEACDGTHFADGYGTCQSYGFSSGTLRCSGDCRADFADCR